MNCYFDVGAWVILVEHPWKKMVLATNKIKENAFCWRKNLKEWICEVNEICKKHFSAQGVAWHAFYTKNKTRQKTSVNKTDFTPAKNNIKRKMCSCSPTALMVHPWVKQWTHSCPPTVMSIYFLEYMFC